MNIAFVRPPQNSKYNDLDVREDTLITYFLGFAKAQGLDLGNIKVFDFVLNKDSTVKEVMESSCETVVITVRETGSNPHYAVRLQKHLSSTGKRVIIYGQTARFKLLQLEKVELVEHSEEALWEKLFPLSPATPTISFEGSFSPEPYYQSFPISENRKHLLKAALESTRGCEFRCKFCYINHGANHAKRWSTRPIQGILEDIEVYYSRGVKNFIFMDSEFIGTDRSRHEDLKTFASEVKHRFPNINFMIYARADTLARFENIQQLREAGLINVFIGVESFFPKDLSEMKKGVTTEKLVASIKELMDAGIFMTLSFITFNRNTTVESLRYNLEVLKSLFASPRRKYLGMPNFIFNFESSWDNSGTHYLSDKTYIKWLVFFKEQPGYAKVLFDTKLEPLMEVYRVLHYEMTKKITELNHESIRNDSVHRWFDNCCLFALGVMERFLDRFEKGELTLSNIRENVAEVYALFAYFNEKTLPIELASCLTKEETMSSLSSDVVDYLDHGWDQNIPLIQEKILAFKVENA